MKTLSEFEELLPIDGDYVTPSSANVGPLENRKDIIVIQNEVGDISNLVYEKTEYFNSDELDTRLEIQTDNLVKMINELKSDIGNKEQLKTPRKTNAVYAINDLKKDMYSNTRLEDILARYTVQRRGNFIKSGLQLSFSINPLTSTFNWYQNFITNNSDVVLSIDKNITSSIILNQILDQGINLVSPELKIDIMPGSAFINGYKISFPESKIISVPYYPLPAEPMIDSIFLCYKTLEELMLPNLWDFKKAYIKGEYCFFNGNEYLAINNISAMGTDPIENTVDWKFIERFDEAIWGNKISYIHYSIGKTTLMDNGKYSYETDIPDNSILLARILKEPNKEPYIEYNKNAKAYLMEDIKDLHVKTIDLFENIARLQSKIDLNTGEVSNSCYNVFTESFYNDNFRDYELEYRSGLPSANAIGGELVPSIEWDTYESNLKDLQLNYASTSLLTSQENYTGSSLINEFSVATNSGYIFDIPPKEFLANTVSSTNVKNVTVTNPTITNRISLNWWQRNISSSSTVSSLVTSTTKVISDSIDKNAQESKYIYPDDITISLAIPRYCFNTSENVDVFVGDKFVQTLLSNIDGSLTESIFLSKNLSLRDTNYNILLKGKTSGAQAQTTLSIISKTRTLVYEKINTTTNTPINTIVSRRFFSDGRGGRGGNGGGGDPLAQTFICEEECYISSISFIFDLQSLTGATRPFGATFLLPDSVNVYITETTTGRPDNEKILHVQTILPGVSCKNNDWFEMALNKAVYLEKGKMYSIFFETTDKVVPKVINGLVLDSNSRICLRTAELGKKWLYAPFTLVNTQPYINGTLFKASNIATWSEYHTLDLAFRIKKIVFTANKSFNEILAINKKYTDICLSSEEVTPEGTNITFNETINYSSGNETLELKEGVIERINSGYNTITNIQRNIGLSTTKTSMTPTLKSNSIKLGNVNEQSVYVSKNIDLNYGNTVLTKNLKVTLTPGMDFNINNIEVFYTTDEIISNNSWIKFEAPTSGFKNEKEYVANNVQLFQNLRIKIVLKVDLMNSDERISIKQLRVFYI